MGGRGSPAHTAAQLVQLRQTKALSVIDQHHRGVGNIHANLHHRCRHQELGLPAAEGFNRLLLFGAAQPAM